MCSELARNVHNNRLSLFFAKMFFFAKKAGFCKYKYCSAKGNCRLALVFNYAFVGFVEVSSLNWALMRQNKNFLILPLFF